MASSVNLFNIGKSGLMVTKQSLTTTGHNIANVNTEGFSRQNVDQTAGPTIANGRLTFGTGAWAKKVSRVSDEYLEKRIQTESKNFSNVEEKDIYLQQTEQIFNESNNDGLNRLATKVFNEFRQLSSDPANTAIRASVREASAQLASDFNRMDREMREVAKNIDARLEGYVREFNALAKEVRDLNLAIEKAELDGGAAPDLHDKRDLAVKKLGAMADISSNRDNNGRITITLAGQVSVVSGENQTDLEVTRTPPDPKTGKKEGSLDIFVREPVPTKLTDVLKTGRLGGLIEIRDKHVSRAQDQIDKVAYVMAKEVNNIHRQGFGLDGGTGRDFFKEPMTKDGAASLFRLSDEVMGSLDSIASAKEPGAPSDNRIAIALSGVGDLKGIADDSNSSILDVYNGTVSELGVKTAANKKSLVFQKDLLSQLENVRDALVGVNLDEETSNLVKFQHAYAANAKVLQVADETMQSILNTFR